MAFNLSDVIQLADAQVQYQEYRAMFNAGSGDIPEKDRDGSGRMDALGNLVFGADHTTLKAPPPPLLQNMLILQKRY